MQKVKVYIKDFKQEWTDSNGEKRAFFVSRVINTSGIGIAGIVAAVIFGISGEWGYCSIAIICWLTLVIENGVTNKIKKNRN